MNFHKLTASIVLISAGVALGGCQRSSTTGVTPDAATVAEERTASSDTATGSVTFEIKTTSDSEPLVFEVPVIADGSTLESIMREIDQVPVVIRGSGVTAFVEKIGSQGTESGKGWTFKIDGEFANQGIGQTTLHPPTTIQWAYGEMPDP